MTQVCILMGSDSDLPVMAEAVKILDSLGVSSEVHVASAHRTPERTSRILAEAPKRGVKVFICGAGSAAHLAGVAAAHTTLPVLGVPLAASDLNGLDALLSTVQMPAGIPVGTLAIGKAGAANAGWLAASILSIQDPVLADKLVQARKDMAAKVEKKSEAAQRKLRELVSG